MTAPYNLTCLYNSGWFQTLNCLIVNSNYVFLYVIYFVLFGILFAVFAGSQQNTKNTLLVASTVTAVVSIFFAIAAGLAGLATSEILQYTTAAIICSTVAVVFLMSHILSDL